MVQFNLVALTLLVLLSWWSFGFEGAVGDPQLFLLKWECSVVAVDDLFNFNQNLNASLADLRVQVSNQSKQFVTVQSTSGADPVYTTTKSSFNIGLLTSVLYKIDVKLNAVTYL